MKKHIKNYKFICLAVLVITGSAGCTKFVNIAPPATQVEAALVFSNDGSAISAINGLYSRMTQTNMTFCSGALTQYPGLSADEFSHSVSSADNDLFLSNNLVADNGTGNYVRLWRSAYATIYNTNAMLEGLQAGTGLTDSVRAQLRGETLVVRSLCYFYLVNLYGSIPFTTTADYSVNQRLERTASTAVYQQLVTDLLEAKTLLGTAYPSINRARPNRWTASALLARIYLYQKEWARAEAEANAVIQSGLYSLPATLNNMFLQSSPETIWQLGKDNGNSGEGFTFVPSSATVRPGFVITNFLLNAFEGADKRKGSWLGKNTVSGIGYYYPFKYKVRATSPISEYYVVFRLAEQYLVRAEARLQQNNLNGAKADLDIVRTRAGLAGVTVNTAPALFDALQKERQTELFLEWGHRWFDLKRWGRADVVLAAVKGTNWQSTDTLYPIPLREMQTNPALTQNPGY